MEGLNGCEPRKVTVKGPYTFTIGNTSGLGRYISGGLFTQVKMPKVLTFVSVTHSTVVLFGVNPNATIEKSS